MRRGRAVAIAVAVVAALATARVGAAKDEAHAEATCASGGEGTTVVREDRDVVIGPLALLGARCVTRHRPNAFGRIGYKIPATLPEGTTAVLSVPKHLQRHVRLVFSVRTSRAVWKRGVLAGDTAVRFVACAPGAEPGRTGWPGGIVVDRRRCATLVVRVGDQAPVRRRVPLGRAC